MSVKIPVFELGNTIQFTWVSTVAPDSAPLFSVREEQSQSIVASVTAIQSASNAFYGLFTIPASEGLFYTAEFLALKTVQGSAYQFTKRLAFKAERTVVE